MDVMSPSSGSWEEVDTLTISHWWTPNNDGDGFCSGFGWNLLSDFQSSTACRVEPTDNVKVIRLVIGGSGAWMDKVAYVDDITLNGKTIKLEPLNWWATPGTDVTFTCTDQEPHPSEDEEICFKVSYDLDVDGDITEEYCEEYEGSLVDAFEEDFCCIPVDGNNQFVFNFNGEFDDDSFGYELAVSFTLWGARRQIEKLKNRLIGKNQGKNIIEEGKFK